MKKIISLCGLVVLAAVVCSSCSDDKVCRCVYRDSGEAHYFEADESESCSDATTSEVICREE